MRRAPVGAVLIAIVTACGSLPASPRPSPSPSVVVVTSPTPAPTPAPTATTPTGRYVNPILGYAVTMPPPWRVTECLSRIETTREPTFIGQDALTWRTAADEQDLGVQGGTGAAGAWGWIILIAVQTSSQSPAEHATARAGGIGGQVQATTLDGKPAARLAGASGITAYYVANAGRMYDIQLMQGIDPRPALVTDAAFDAIARSITFVTPAPRPTPSPTPSVTPAVEAIADAVTAALAASDADRVRDLITPTCWFNAGYYQSEGTATSRDKFIARLRTAFSEGLKVTVDPRPIKPDPPMPGTFWIWSTWLEYRTPSGVSPRSNVQLVFDQVDGRWYWIGALYNAVR